MAITPPTYSPSGSIFGTTTTTTPYTYGDLTVPTTSAYNIWGSKGNPYYYAGPGYTPGAGAPIVPVPITPATPYYSGGDSGDSGGGDDGSPRPGEYDSEVGGATYGDWYSGRDAMDRAMNPSWGQLLPGVGALSSIDSVFAGVNPTPFGDRIWDNYTGPGMAASNQFGLNKGEQRDMIVGQEYDFWDNPYEEQQWRNESRSPARNEYSNLLSNFQQGKKLGTVPETKTWGDYYNENKTKTDNNNWNATGFGNDKGRGFTSVKTFGDLNNATAQEANRLQTEAQSFLAQHEARNQDPNYGFTPTDTITGNTGGWSNPAANDNINTLGGRTGTTGLDGAPAPTVSWSDTPNSAGNTTGTFTSKEMGSTNVTDYGGGNYSIDVGEDDEVGWEDPGGDDDSGGGGSYIATAATQALGEEGLTVFNNWRDHMRNVVPEFTVSFGRYRVTAPKIVAEIDTKEDSKRIYKDIWDKHLKPIYALIVADRDSVKAQDDYRIMVRELMNKYLKGDK